MINKYPKISFITACKGRLHHLAETLPKNIIWNQDYPNLEFVLLDYNSPDGLESWVKKYMSGIIKKGLLVYYKNPEPEFFHYTHSRNMLLKLASGDIICNLDADNYTGEDFAFYIAERLEKVDLIFASKWVEGEGEGNGMFAPLIVECFGRLAIKKSAILHAGGYFEALEHWGAEDKDLYSRLLRLGYSFETFPLKFLRCISHSNVERGAYTKVKDVGFYCESHKENNFISNENINNGNFIVNNGEFGKGTVYKNFSKKPFKVL